MRYWALLLYFAANLAWATEPIPCREQTARIPLIGLRLIADGLDRPVHIAAAPGESNRLYVVEQAGTIRVIQDGKLLAQHFLDIRDRVESGGEKGLLSIAFHPQYLKTGWFFLDYTTRDNGKLYTIVSRFQRASDGSGDAHSEEVLLKIEQPYGNHNGGQLAFGPDGFLYIGMGDGGGANDPHGNGQNRGNLLGDLLRIDVDAPSPARAYAIPANNPFINQRNARPEIYAYGLRNPWRFSFDARTGLLYLADVGQDAEEEIDVIRKGKNYGWNIMEGGRCTPAVNRRCHTRGLEFPIATYDHPTGFSVTGGFVYRGSRFPALCGVYLYADYVTKRIWGLRYDGKRVTAQRELLHSDYAISSFGQDNAFELYVADHEGGDILQIVAPEREH